MCVKVGDKIEIIHMIDEPQYDRRKGIVTSIDNRGQLHGTWGGLALIPAEDFYIVVNANES